MKLLKKLCCLCCVFALCTAFSQNAAFADKSLTIVFIGEPGSGKSALRAVLTNTPFDFSNRYPTRIPSEVRQNLRYFNTLDIACHLVDTCGAPKVKNKVLTDRLNGADIAVFVVDLSDDGEDQWSSFHTDWLREIHRLHPTLPILIVGTKADEDGVDLGKCRKRMEHLMGLFEGGSHMLIYVFVSAKEGANLGDPKDDSDQGDNFWGRIRFLIVQSDMDRRLRDDLSERSFPKDSDSLDKRQCILQ